MQGTSVSFTRAAGSSGVFGASVSSGSGSLQLSDLIIFLLYLVVYVLVL